MSATDPLSTVWDALERAGCEPHGKPFDFRARCPAHDGENRESLHVWVGADGRAALWCHAHHCDVEEIASALALSVSDLFPAGHRNARRLQLTTTRRSDFTDNAKIAANALAALEQLGEHWRVEITTDCPYCGSPHAQLVVGSDRDAFAHCLGGCTPRMFVEALAGLIADQRESS